MHNSEIASSGSLFDAHLSSSSEMKTQLHPIDSKGSLHARTKQRDTQSLVNDIVHDLLRHVCNLIESIEENTEISNSTFYLEAKVDLESKIHKKRFDSLIKQEDHYLISFFHQIEGGRLQFLNQIGKGGYGEVYKGVFTESKTQKTKVVAIKVNRIFKDTKKTIAVMQNLKNEAINHQKISAINLRGQGPFVEFITSGALTSNRYCIVQELCSHSLFQLMKQRNFLGLPIHKVFLFAKELLAALKLLREQKFSMVHTDLKPENIVLPNLFDQKIKLIDFGMIQRIVPMSKESDFIGSRNFSAPEISLRIPIDFSLDIWSLGCILFELYTGKQLFKSKNDQEHILMIQKLIGPIPKSFIEKSCYFFSFEPSLKEGFYEYVDAALEQSIKNTKDHFDACFEIAKQQALKGSSFEKVYLTDETEFLLKDLILSMLRWDQKDRLSPNELFDHPFMHTMQLLIDQHNYRSAFALFKKKEVLDDKKVSRPWETTPKNLQRKHVVKEILETIFE